MPQEIEKVEVIERDERQGDAPPRIVVNRQVVYSSGCLGCLIQLPILLIKMPYLIFKTYWFARRAAREMAQAQGRQQKDVVITIRGSDDQQDRN